jgi:hypothetical protein
MWQMWILTIGRSRLAFVRRFLSIPADVDAARARRMAKGKPRPVSGKEAPKDGIGK